MKTIRRQLGLLTLIFLTIIVIQSCSKDSVKEDKSLRPDLYTYVPDDNFEQLLINQGYDDKLDNYLLTSNVINVTSILGTNGYKSLFFDPSGINNFKGIEAFINLESFDCSLLNLNKLDLSNNVVLKNLSCSFNNLKSLDLTNLTELETLDCSYNNLTSLKLNSASLTYLSCHENRLSELDISKTNNLLELTCFNNKLTSLNIRSNVGLKSLQVGENLLVNLDISNNVALKYVECFLNPQLKCVQVNENQLNGQGWSFCSKDLFSLNCE